MASIELSASRFSPRDLLRVLFKRKTAIALCFGAMVAAVTLFCFFWPPTYEARVRFLLRQNREEPVISSDQESVRMISRQAVTDSDLNTEMEILQSQGTLEKTVRDVDLEHIPQHWAIRLAHLPAQGVARFYNWYHGMPNPDAFTSAVVRLREKVFVIPQKKSAIIDVRVRWGDHDLSEKLLARLTDNYLTQHLAVTKAPDTRKFFLAQAEEKKSELIRIEALMDAIQPGATMDTLRLQQDLIAKQASDFQDQWHKARTSQQEASAARDAYRHELETVPSRVVYEDKPLFSDQALGSLNARVLQLRLTRTELLQKFQPNNRLVLQNEEELKQAEAILEHELANPYSQKTTNVNAVAQNLDENLLLERAKVSSFGALADATHKELAAINKQLRLTNRQAVQIRALDRARSAAADAYLQYLKRAEDARVDDELNGQRMINVAAIEPISAGYAPVRPNAKLIFELVLSVGLLLAIAFGFLLELLDHRIRTEEDIEDLLGVPVITTFDLLPYEAALGSVGQR